MTKNRIKKIFAVGIVSLTVAISTIAPAHAAEEKGAEACPQCFSLTTSRKVYGAWVNGENATCIHYPYGYDLMQTRSVHTQVTCTKCGYSCIKGQTRETRRVCHGRTTP